MAARDRDRRSQLVRDIVQQTLLALEQLRTLACEPLHGLKRRLPAPGVPHHRDEHGRHERHLEQLAPELSALKGVVEDHDAGRRRHGREHDRRRAQAPHPEAVQDREAHPDEVERDRLPAR